MRLAFRFTGTLVLALLLSPALALAREPPPDPPASPAAPLPADRPWSVSLATGAGGYVEFVDAFSNGGPGGHDSSQRSRRLQLNVRADRQLGPWFRVGLAWTYNRWTETYFSGGAEVGSIDNQAHTLLADVTLRWFRAEHVELYSALAVGAGRWGQAGTGIGTTQDGVQSGFAFQLRYLGINAGNDRLRAFLDLGLGFEGLVVAGMTLRF
jgi:hypothetical protein